MSIRRLAVARAASALVSCPSRAADPVDVPALAGWFTPGLGIVPTRAWRASARWW